MEINKHKATQKLQVEEKDPLEFFIPDCCCPERYPTPMVPSPTSCVTEEELEEIEEKIDEANALLLMLGLGDDIPSNQMFQQIFDGVIGLEVEIMLNLETPKKVEGRVFLVGFDFVLLHNSKVDRIVPFQFIGEINIVGRYAKPKHVLELRTIDPCFRRDLTYHFGEVVSASPELLQIFFRMGLHVYLLLLEAKRVKVYLDDEFFEGLLKDVNKESIVVKVKEEMKIIPLKSIVLLEKR
ncbi:hypothetical protein [Bacillus suaedae]|uniref:Uncharacterized protein n=1 Tax=Halalkalibacter suaedae TaxID=2822140 RepID=A0A940WXD7_9BACI|nr:hypothetical protein [Bacillus suaedae]MBP3952263.1 hypothetical protein [Bacillus suaedae]